MKLGVFVAGILLTFNVAAEINFSIENLPQSRIQNLFFRYDDSYPLITVAYDIGIILHNVQPNASSQEIFIFYINNCDAGFGNRFYTEDNNSYKEIIINSIKNKSITSHIQSINCNNCPISIYDLNQEGMFLKLATQAGHNGAIYQGIKDSPCVFGGRKISLQDFDEYKKLIFENIKIGELTNKILTFGINSDCALFQHSKDVFSISSTKENNDSIRYLLDFSDPKYFCKIECFRKDALIQQVAYLKTGEISSLLFCNILNNKVVIRCVRRGDKTLFINYILEQQDDIYLYPLKITPSDTSLDVQEVAIYKNRMNYGLTGLWSQSANTYSNSITGTVKASQLSLPTGLRDFSKAILGQRRLK